MSSPPHEYRLQYEPDGRSWTSRENLVDVLEREVLGPANGPEEELEGPPDSAYLVGRIAPTKLSDGKGDPEGGDDGEAPADVGDAEDAEASRGVPLTAVDESSAGSEEDEVEDRPQQRGLMIPASMGLRFQVPDDLDAFTVTADWGVYRAVEREDADRESGRKRVHKRTPVEVVQKISIGDLKPGQTKTYQLKDEVLLRVDRALDPAGGRSLIEVALCNDRTTPRKIPVEAWLYQTKLTVDAGGEEAFLPVFDPLETDRDERDEVLRLTLQYRDRLEFAIGRTCSADWEQPPGSRRATRVWTTWLPTVETPQTTAEEIDEALLDMTRLAEAEPEELRAGLSPIVDAYAVWLDGEEERATTLPAHLRETADEAVTEARRVAKQLAEGLDFLLADAEALRCFHFMNRVMADQRIQSQVAELRAQNPKLTLADARQKVLGRDKPHSWRTFQLAFILMQLPLLSDPANGRRSGDLAKAQLLFFPTGGGKTEAYLGLAAYTFAVRRRQGITGPPDDEVNGGSGVAVLMRYTLRLLTSQQFQRATALVCAAELARRSDVATWGTEPFRIGLWVGTDVSPKWYDEAKEQIAKARERAFRLTVLQIKRCPWCGTPIGAGDLRTRDADRRIFVYCGDELGRCPFSQGGAAGEGLPVLTVDEEIYRLTPAFVIATVDKFARLAREGDAASLFGYVSQRCGRHGYVHPDYSGCDLKPGSKHYAREGLPAAGLYPAGRLRPPDLIIQDELHLITGALGTTVGLFEVAIDVMCGWRAPGGTAVRPLIVASTATARNAADQVGRLYGRDVTIFPPQVLDAGKTFFSKEEPVSADKPGRRYVGISTTGVRLTTAEIRLAEVLMAGSQLMLDRSGADADPYMTLVGYFSATRELAGMARYLGDDVQTALSRGRPWSRLPRRYGAGFGQLNTSELTSRVASADITTTLDQMAIPFDPAVDTNQARSDRIERVKAGETIPRYRDVHPYDAILATSMLQVGVDVTRLGLMLVVGQPKNTAEYIQATSRVGRDPSRPGLVVTLGNWARPRDLAHFEQFRRYHERFYAEVEALSVTPFSITSMQRGLDGVLVSAARVLQAPSGKAGLSPERNAERIDDHRDFVEGLIEALVARIAQAADEDAAERAKQRLLNRLDQWSKRKASLVQEHKSLAYERGKTDDFGPLMISPDNARALDDRRHQPPFEVPNSMREVQPEINLLVSPTEENLFFREPLTAPPWEMPSESSTAGQEEGSA